MLRENKKCGIRWGVLQLVGFRAATAVKILSPLSGVTLGFPAVITQHKSMLVDS